MVDQVTFPPSIGGSGKTYTNDANPQTGMFNGGHRVNFFPILADTVAAAGFVSQYAQAIDGAAVNADLAEDAKRYVEAVAETYSVNLLEQFKATATLGLDFIGGSYWKDDGERIETSNPNELLTITRTTAKKTEGPNERFREYLANTLARKWDNGVAIGSVLEERRTNLLLHSSAFDNAAWIQTGSLSAVQSANTIGPDGNPAYLVTNSGGAGLIRQTVSLSNQKNVGSCYVKGIYGETAKIETRAANSSAVAQLQFTFNGEWQRVDNSSIAADWSLQTDSSVSFAIRVDSPNSATEFYISSAQMETGDYPSSHIETTTAPVTREPDSFSRLMGGEFNKRAFTLFFEDRFLIDNQIASVNSFLSIGENPSVNSGGFSNGGLDFWNWSGANGRSLRAYTANGIEAFSFNATSSGNFPSENSRAKQAISFENGNISWAVAGTLVASYNGGDVSIPDVAYLASGVRPGATGHEFGFIFIKPTSSSIAELEELTAQ